MSDSEPEPEPESDPDPDPEPEPEPEPLDVENTDPCTGEGPKTFIEWLKCCSGPGVNTAFRATAGWIFALDSEAMSIARPGEIVPYPYVIVARLAICWCGYFVSTDATCGKPVTKEDTEAAARVAWDDFSDETKKEYATFKTYHETMFMDQWSDAAKVWNKMSKDEQSVFGSFDAFNIKDQRENKKSLFTRFGDWSIKLCDSLIVDVQASESVSKANARARPLLETSFGTVQLERIKSALGYIFSGAAEWVSAMLQAIFQVMKGSSEFLRGIVKFVKGKIVWKEEPEHPQHWVTATYLVIQNLWHIFSQGKLKLGEDPGFKELFGTEGALSTAYKDMAGALQKVWEQLGFWKAIYAGASVVIEIPSYFAKTLFLLLVRNFDRFMRDRLAAAIELMRYGLNVCITNRRLKDTSFLWNKQEESKLPVSKLMEYAFSANGDYRDEFFLELYEGAAASERTAPFAALDVLQHYKAGKAYTYTLWKEGLGKKWYEGTIGVILETKAEEVQTGLMWVRCCLELFNPDLTIDAEECIPFYSLIETAAGKAMSQLTFGEKLKKMFTFKVSTKPAQQLKSLIWPTPLIVRMARRAKSGTYKYTINRKEQPHVSEKRKFNAWAEKMKGFASKAAREKRKLRKQLRLPGKRIQCGNVVFWHADDYVRRRKQSSAGLRRKQSSAGLRRRRREKDKEEGETKAIKITRNCTNTILQRKCYYFSATKTWVCDECIMRYLRGPEKEEEPSLISEYWDKKNRFIDDQGTVLQENPCMSLVPLRF
jgi:hypothetical protein